MTDWHVLGLDADPAPGDPDRTAELAQRLLRQAERADHNQTRLSQVAAGGGDLHMEGGYAPGFRQILSELPHELGKLSCAWRGSGEALGAFASDLRQEQSRAATALRNGTDAAARYDGALREIRSLLGGRDLEIAPILGVEHSVEQATEGLDEATRAQARSAARRAHAAEQDRAAARRLAEQAARLRGEAEQRAAEGIDRALDASGIKNRSWWQKAWDVVSWPFTSWDHFVSFCRGVAFVVGVVALFVSGPVGWALVGVALAAGAVAFGDTLVRFTQGRASLADLALDALGLIPGSAGAVKLAGLGTRIAEAGPRLLAMARDLPETGRVVLAGLRDTKGAFGESIRGSLQDMRAFARDARCRFLRSDPVDMATGEMILTQAPDVVLPGVLPFVLQRTHRSAYRTGRWFGRSWSSTIEHRLEVDALGVCYAGEDGLLFSYPMPPEGGTVLPEDGPRRPLARTSEGFSVTDPSSGQTLHFVARSGSGNGPAAVLPLAAVTDRNGNRIDIDYDADGALSGIRHSGGYHLDVDTQRGRITEIRLRVGAGQRDLVLVRYEYDAGGNLVGVVNSSGRPLRFEYDEQGRMAGWEDRNGNWYRYTYDDQDRCIATSGLDGYMDGSFRYDKSKRTTVETSSLGHITTFHFNDLLQVERVVDPRGGVTIHEWDRYDRKVAETDPLGRTTRYAYDESGNLASVTQPDGSGTTLVHNELRLPVRITEPDGGTWLYRYDERGNLVAETDPAGSTTTYDYDDRGHLRAVTDALGHVRRVETDAAGLPVSIADPASATTRYLRDPLGRVVEVTDALGGATQLAWTIEGLLASRTLPDGALERWVHDAEGNLVERIDAIGQSTKTEIGPFGLPRARTGPDGARTEFAHDTQLQLVSVTGPHGRSWTYEYDQAGNLERETDFDGRVLTYAYDAAGQLVDRTNGAGETTHFAYDVLGNVVEQRSGDAVTTFGHDPLGRLVRASNGDCELTLELDPLGRILAETCNGRSITSAYDALGRRIERRTPTGATSSWRYEASYKPSSLETGGRSLRFVHDTLGREIERQLGRRIERRTPTGATSSWRYEASYKPSSLETGGRSLRFVHDTLGREIERQLGRRSTVWGVGGGVGVGQGANPVDCPLRFPGQYHDPETGSHYNIFRYYDPHGTRYLASDPLGLFPGPDPHAYVPNPSAWIDPLGLAGQPGEGEVWVRPHDLRFSQRTAGGGNPPRAPALRQQLASGWDPSKGPIDVVQTEHGLTTFDNTRVAVAQELNIDGVTARVRQLSDALPPGFAEQRGLVARAERMGLPAPATWEDALRIRTKANRLPLEGTLTRPRLPC